jgi:hypothetical protein
MKSRGLTIGSRGFGLDYHHRPWHEDHHRANRIPARERRRLDRRTKWRVPQQPPGFKTPLQLLPALNSALANQLLGTRVPHPVGLSPIGDGRCRAAGWR